MNLTLTKKIIAREGLIILSLLVLGGLCCYGTFIATEGGSEEQKFDFVYDVKVGNNKYEAVINSDFIDEIGDAEKLSIMKALREQGYAKDIGADVIPADLEVSGVHTRYTLIQLLQGAAGYLTLFFVILAYPLYLILRFVVWAIKTVREK